MPWLLLFLVERSVRSLEQQVPRGVEDWGDQLASKTMEIPSTGMAVGIRTTRTPSPHRSLGGKDTGSTDYPGKLSRMFLDYSEQGAVLATCFQRPVLVTTCMSRNIYSGVYRFFFVETTHERQAGKSLLLFNTYEANRALVLLSNPSPTL